MKRRALADTGLELGVVGLGCVYFGFVLNEDEARAVVDAAVDAGINYLDIADVYGHPPGECEAMVGRILKGRRDKVVLSTKVGGIAFFERKGTRWGKREYLTRSLDASLQRLGTDRIDLYQLQFPDPTTPIAETLETLDDFVKQGKVRAIGHSNFSQLDLEEADDAATSRKLPRFVSGQNEWSLLVRGIERDVIPASQRRGVSQIPARALASGLLTGKYKLGEAPAPGTRMADLKALRFQRSLTRDNLTKVRALEAFAAERGKSLLDLSVSWLLAHDCVVTVPLGARNRDQVTTNAQAGSWKLSADELKAIDAIVPVKVRTPAVMRKS